MTDQAEEALERARTAAQSQQWDDAYAGLTQADQSHALGPDDLETLATAAYLAGHVDIGQDALQRAHQLLVEADENRRAAKCSFWLAFQLLNRGEVGQAGGWLAHGQRLLADEPEQCPEQGYLLVLLTFQDVIAGDHPGAEEKALRLAAIGQVHGDANLIACALHFRGRIRLKQLHVEEGLSLLDESMVAVVTGELSPIIAGHLYCSLIDACHEISELGRAQEWTAALTDWCERQNGMVTFTGQCLVHRAQMLHLHGKWPQAEEEAKTAQQRFETAADRAATGAALYCQAEIQRTKGQLEAAEVAFREAGEWGHDPQPGLALLRLAQGKGDVAEASVSRALSETDDPPRRAGLLVAQAEIRLANGDVEAARQAAEELAAIAVSYDTLALRAHADHIQGAVLLAEGDAGPALNRLRQAHLAWLTLEAPYEAARVRVLIGLSCRALGDEEAGRRELETAQGVFQQLGAALDLDRLTHGEAAYGLTDREMEVLALVATGKTNQAIGDDLFISVKTVDRHVANIFTKLGVTSRAAATAFAYQHELLST